MANKPYALSAINQTDFATHFTVVGYDNDEAVAATQVCFSRCPYPSLSAWPRRHALNSYAAILMAAAVVLATVLLCVFSVDAESLC